MASSTYVGDYCNEPLDLFVLNNMVICSSSSSSTLSSSPSSSSASYCSDLREQENRVSSGYGDLFSPCPSPYSPLSVLDPEFHGSLPLIFEDPFLQADQAMSTSSMGVESFDPFDCILPTSIVSEPEQSNGTGCDHGDGVRPSLVQNNGFAEELPLMLASNVQLPTSRVALVLPSNSSMDRITQSGDVAYGNCIEESPVGSTAMSGFRSSPHSPRKAAEDVVNGNCIEESPVGSTTMSGFRSSPQSQRMATGDVPYVNCIEESPVRSTTITGFQSSSQSQRKATGDVAYVNCIEECPVGSITMTGIWSSPQSPTPADRNVSGCDSNHQNQHQAEASGGECQKRKHSENPIGAHEDRHHGENVDNEVHQHQNYDAAAVTDMAKATLKSAKKAKLSESGHCLGDIHHQMMDKKQIIHDQLNAYVCNSSLNMMKEVVYAQAALQPVDWDSIIAATADSRPKRRNVRISKDPQSISARRRRERISDRIRVLQQLVPNGTKMDTASMLDEAIHYLKFLKSQVQALEWLEKSSPSLTPTSTSSASGSSSSTSISLSLPLASSLNSSSSSPRMPYYCPTTLICPSVNSQMWMNNGLPSL